MAFIITPSKAKGTCSRLSYKRPLANQLLEWCDVIRQIKLPPLHHVAYALVSFGAVKKITSRLLLPMLNSRLDWSLVEAKQSETLHTGLVEPAKARV
jgi:hypothetical protein